MSQNSFLNLNGRKLILASTSPRRADLLKMLGLKFEIIESKLDESEESFTVPEVYVLELARKKALKVAGNIRDALIIAADTIVVLDGKILGKPIDSQEARTLLSQLSGRTHTVYTGFAVVEKPSGRILNEYAKTKVSFRKIDDNEIECYVKSEKPLDKAGAYGIQDEGALFVDSIEGCFYNVMGLPLTRVYRALRHLTSRGLTER